MIMSMILLDDWLFPQGTRHPTRDRVIDQIVTMILTGVEGTPPTSATHPA
jgi:hypothetical protein